MTKVKSIDKVLINFFSVSSHIPCASDKRKKWWNFTLVAQRGSKTRRQFAPTMKPWVERTKRVLGKRCRPIRGCRLWMSRSGWCLFRSRCDRPLRRAPCADEPCSSQVALLPSSLRQSLLLRRCTLQVMCTGGEKTTIKAIAANASNNEDLLSSHRRPWRPLTAHQARLRHL